MTALAVVSRQTSADQECALYWTALEQVAKKHTDTCTNQELSGAVQQIIEAHHAAVKLELEKEPLRNAEEGTDPSLPDGLNYLIRQDNSRIRNAQKEAHEAAMEKIFIDIGISTGPAQALAEIAKASAQKHGK